MQVKQTLGLSGGHEVRLLTAEVMLQRDGAI